MKIEILFSEVCDLYGDLGNIKFLEKNFQNNAQIIKTSLNDEIQFTKDQIDLVYIGSFSEIYYNLIVNKLSKEKDKIIEKIKEGQLFLATGNAFDLFGKNVILDKRYIDKNFITSDSNKNTLDYYNLSLNTDENEKLIDDLSVIDDKYILEGLELYNTTAISAMLLRQNSGILSDITFNGESLKLLGFKNTFTQSYLIKDNLSDIFDSAKYFSKVIRGLGLHEGSHFEGIQINNFIATYTLGPLLVSNPTFSKELFKKARFEDKLFVEEELLDAYDKKLKEFENPNLDLGTFINKEVRGEE